MAKRMSYNEYKRRVFNDALLECFASLHNMIIDESCDADKNEDGRCHRKTATQMRSNYDAERAYRMAKAFYEQELDLKKSTVLQTKTKLIGKNSFIDDIVEICECIANDKAQTAAEEELDMPEGLKTELSDEDQVLIDKVFEEKTPETEIDAVRDAMVQALVVEDQKAEEIRNAIDMTKSTAGGEENGGAQKIEEAVNRISRRGPTSLLNAIMTAISSEAVKDVFQESGAQPISGIMSTNREQIRNRSLMMYALYEMANVFNIHNYTPAEVEKIAREIYYQQ